MATRVGVTASVIGNPIVPESEASWKALFDDPTVGAIYANIVYDFIALLLAKIGQALTEFGIDGDQSKLDKSIEEVRAVLQVKPTVGG